MIFCIASLHCRLIGLVRLIHSSVVVAGSVILIGMLLTSSADAADLEDLTVATTRNRPDIPFFEPVCHAQLSGQIAGPDASAENEHERLGDAEFYASTIAAISQRFGPRRDGEFLALCLVSSGGDLVEATRLAKLFRGWMMVIEDKAYCFSACAVLFMSAQARNRVFMHVAGAPGRYLHHSGTLAFHAPRLNFPGEEACRLANKPLNADRTCSLAPAEAAQLAQNAYDDALASIRQVANPSEETGGSDLPVAEHQNKRWRFADRITNPYSRDLPADLLLAFLTVPSNDDFTITRIDEAIRWGIDLYGVPPPPVLTDAMLASACINLSAARCQDSPAGECAERALERVTAAMSGTKGLGHNSFEDLQAELNKLQKDLRNASVEPICSIVADPRCASMNDDEQTELRKKFFDDTQKRLLAVLGALQSGHQEAPPALFGPFSMGLTLGGQRLTRQNLSPLNSKRQLLWTTEASEESRVDTELFELRLHTLPVCNIRAAWQASETTSEPQLINLKIDVATLETDVKGPLMAVIDPDPVDTEQPAEGNSKRYDFAPWMMLAAGTVFSDLSGPDPWGWLSKGENFFKRPPNWRQQ